MDDDDPKGLIREAYRIEGITAGECRSIFLDWALSHPLGDEARPRLERLLARYGQSDPDHPMTGVMQDGLTAPANARRRGGRRARVERDEGGA